MGTDVFSDNHENFVYFSDYSWYDGEIYSKDCEDTDYVKEVTSKVIKKIDINGKMTGLLCAAPFSFSILHMLSFPVSPSWYLVCSFCIYIDSGFLITDAGRRTVYICRQVMWYAFRQQEIQCEGETAVSISFYGRYLSGNDTDQSWEKGFTGGYGNFK